MPKGIPQDIPDAIEAIGELLEIRGKENDAFRIRAYKRAAQILRDHVSEIEERVKQGTLTQLSGIGEAIAEKVEEYVKTGKIKAYEDLKKTIPDGLLDILRVPGLGPKKAKILYQKLKVKDIGSLQKALESGKVVGLPGFQERMVEKLLEGIALLEGFTGRRLLGEVMPTVEAVIGELKKCKAIEKLEVGGSYRRREETIGDIDVLVLAHDRAKVGQCIRNLPGMERIIAEGEEKISFLLHDGLQIDIRMIDPQSWGAALQYFTGSKAHNVELRSLAKSKGLKLNEYGVFRMRGKNAVKISGRTEEEVYGALGMDWMPPELRQGSGEIQSALAGRLPTLIERKDIKGDLHVHSTWSDGQDTIEEVAKAADRLGYEYIAISDHSPSLRIAAGPKTKAQILKKKKEIEAVQKKVKVKILCGTEVDIKMDGSLDYSDDLLKLFDVVIASIHSGFTTDATKRLLKAIHHPLVHAIGHPTGRHLGSRNPYPFDVDVVIEACVKTGTWLEVNGQPTRLDLPFALVRKAKEMGACPPKLGEAERRGAKFIVSSDAHSASGLGIVDLGVSVARRGWLEKKDIINTRHLKDFLKLLQQ